jgi:hypothetical protein
MNLPSNEKGFHREAFAFFQVETVSEINFDRTC